MILCNRNGDSDPKKREAVLKSRAKTDSVWMKVLETNEDNNRFLKELLDHRFLVGSTDMDCGQTLEYCFVKTRSDKLGIRKV